MPNLHQIPAKFGADFFRDQYDRQEHGYVVVSAIEGIQRRAPAF